MSKAIVLMLLLVSSLAGAEDRRYWRVKIISPASGELAAWPKNACGQDVADNVWRIVSKRPYMEVVDDTFAARIDEPKPVIAKRSSLGDVFVGFYDPSDDRTIVFTIRWKHVRGNQVPVEVSVIVHSDPNDRTKACRETWIGTGERI